MLKIILVSIALVLPMVAFSREYKVRIKHIPTGEIQFEKFYSEEELLQLSNSLTNPKDYSLLFNAGEVNLNSLEGIMMGEGGGD